MKKKLILTFLTIAVLATAAVVMRFYVNKNKTEIYYWRTSPVEKGDVKVIITATGSVAADTTVNVGTQVTGILKKEYVDFNSVVKKGQVIARIDTTTLYPTMLDAKASLERAEVQRDESKREYERQKKLFDQKVIAEADYELALSNYQTAEATVKSMNAQYVRAITNLRYAVIRSPINGIIISRTYDEGITVIASFNTPTLFVIANNLKKMQVQANVDEADIGQVKEGQEVDFTVDAYPDEVFHGVTKQVRLQPVMVQNVVNYVVIVEAPNPDLKLLPGLTANINIRVKEHKGILRVPANALSFNPPPAYLDKATTIPDSVKRKVQVKAEQSANKIIAEQEFQYIWIKKGSDIFPVSVKKGLTDGVFTEIEGDIKESDLVVTGLNSSAVSAQETSPQTGQQNPFMPKMRPQGKKK